MAKDHFVRARVSDWEKGYVQYKANEAHMNESQYLRDCIFFHKTTVIKGLDELLLELRRQGNNLNQLTKLAHQGAVDVVNLESCLEEYRKVWQALNSLQSRSH